VIEPDQHDGRAAGRLSASDSATANLLLRIASAVVLAPVVLACTYAGGAVFLAVCAAAAGVVLWEWTALATRRGDARILAPGFAAIVVAALFVEIGHPASALSVIAIGAIVTGCIMMVWARGLPRLWEAAWGTTGVVYAGAMMLGPALLRRDPEWGLTALLFLFATVWITDIFAYFVGRAIGGPLLWPRISPKKTWSGAVGGLIGGVAAGVGVAYASGVGELGLVGVMGLLLSVLAQAGDLFESAVKRRFGAKDAGQLIPGHGGVMDRIDGFLVAAFGGLLIGIMHQGIAAPARGLLVW
jgi:phosphatidate cytidylyltransferase